ncbi:hypothetical protein [Microbispora amethystogenes]|uniref:Uncharacterized protein n=1 Tax=Microbispora amethystogenes TaxID=1427754 RepID=A0ABQ4FEM7_9ACTN|nr:hypothetical protein [Microbispora amethystogenes]GIH33261.1 hypothetical protein Mam01_34250 [Microbispora amethystogenes]
MGGALPGAEGIRCLALSLGLFPYALSLIVHWVSFLLVTLLHR